MTLLDQAAFQPRRVYDTRDVVLSVRDLSVNYLTRNGDISAVSTVTLDLYKGEILGLVGESGCGKSTLGRALIGLIPSPGRVTNGQIYLHGNNLLELDEAGMRQVRGRDIAMIFQDPMSCLNPVQRIDQHIIEAILTHEPQTSKKEARRRASDIMERLGIESNRLQDHPHQLSGGMRQRVMIALALALRAKVIIADEATTALDVIVQAQFLELMREIKDEFDLSILMITHNIGVVAQLADRVAVMYAGRIVEVGPTEDIFYRYKHPYTEGLLKSVPNIDLEEQSLYRMDGLPPNLLTPPSGCRFHPRCPHTKDICREKHPWIVRVDEVRHTDWLIKKYQQHIVSCWLYQDQLGAESSS